jgi:hypothetical protein
MTAPEEKQREFQESTSDAAGPLSAARIMGRLIAFDPNVMELPHEG